MRAEGSELLVEAKVKVLRRLLAKSGEATFLESIAKEMLRLEGEAADLETERNQLKEELNCAVHRLESSYGLLSATSEARDGSA